ncbi:MAG: hypothetical protein ACRD2T_07905, partial [Thermoanaerobaculia bacterium]
MLDLFSERRGAAGPPSRLARAGIGCPRCGMPLDLAVLASGPQTCPSCGVAFEAVLFDPPVAPAGVTRLGEAGPGAGTACANHAGNLATAHCGRCGLLICDLCRIETEGLVLCPQCFERLSAADALPGARKRYADLTGVSFLLSFAGLLTCFFAPLLGPAAVYCAVRASRKRRELGESRVGPIVALITALLVTGVGLF